MVDEEEKKWFVAKRLEMIMSNCFTFSKMSASDLNKYRFQILWNTLKTSGLALPRVYDWPFRLDLPFAKLKPRFKVERTPAGADVLVDQGVSGQWGSIDLPSDVEEFLNYVGMPSKHVQPVQPDVVASKPFIWDSNCDIQGCDNDDDVAMERTLAALNKKEIADYERRTRQSLAFDVLEQLIHPMQGCIALGPTTVKCLDREPAGLTAYVVVCGDHRGEVWQANEDFSCIFRGRTLDSDAPMDVWQCFEILLPWAGMLKTIHAIP